METKWRGLQAPGKEEESRKFPFLINNGRTNHVWQSAYLDQQNDFCMDRNPLPFIEMNPQDMAELNLKPGDLVEVYNDNGSTQEGFRIRGSDRHALLLPEGHCVRNMATDNTTVVLGIPIPSTDPVFLAIVGVHVLFGIAAVITGAVAMLSRKGRGRHSHWGAIYFWCLAGVFVTMSALSFMRWAANYHLFILGALSFACGYFGRAAARRHWHQWPRLHLSGMAASYVLMVTAFYVDNGKNLPLWRELPEIAFWFLPGAVGLPLVLHALYRHPFVLSFDRLQADIVRPEYPGRKDRSWRGHP